MRAFRERLIACLEQCSAGRCGLFSDFEHLGAEPESRQRWPEAARLRELAFALQAILSQSDIQSGERGSLCEQFLDLCSIHGENDPGEAKLARAFLQEIVRTDETRKIG